MSTAIRLARATAALTLVCALAITLSCWAATQPVFAQVPTVQFQGTYRGLSPYIDWAWWLTSSQKCAETQPFYGSEPATGGPYPVVIYLHGTLADWGNNAEGQKFVGLAASHGFVAAAFTYDSWITWDSPTDTDLHANCMFNANPRISLVSTSKLAGVPASNVFSPFTIDS